MKIKKYLPTPIAELPSITAEKVRRAFSPIMGKVCFEHTPYLITNRGNPAMVWLGVEDYENLVDMIDTMAEQLDPEFQKSLQEGYKEIKEGDGVSEEELDSILNKKIEYAG